MAAQKGREVLIKLGDGESPQNYTTLAGALATSMTFSEDGVDVTDKDSPEQWREMIRAGVRSCEMTTEGHFKDAAVDTTLLNELWNGTPTPEEMQFVMPDFFTFEGLWICTNYELNGNHDNAAGYSATFQSAGQITETAA